METSKPFTVEEGKEIPSIEIIDDKLIITITADELAFITEHKNGGEYTVLDKTKFLTDFKFQLENFANSNATELGCSELQYLFDQYIDAIYEDGSESIKSNFFE